MTCTTTDRISAKCGVCGERPLKVHVLRLKFFCSAHCPSCNGRESKLGTAEPAGDQMELL